MSKIQVIKEMHYCTKNNKCYSGSCVSSYKTKRKAKKY